MPDAAADEKYNLGASVVGEELSKEIPAVCGRKAAPAEKFIYCALPAVTPEEVEIAPAKFAVGAWLLVKTETP